MADRNVVVFTVIFVGLSGLYVWVTSGASMAAFALLSIVYVMLVLLAGLTLLAAQDTSMNGWVILYQVDKDGESQVLHGVVQHTFVQALRVMRTTPEAIGIIFSLSGEVVLLSDLVPDDMGKN